MEDLIVGAFARELEANRDRYNYLFRIAKQNTPALDAQAFANHLRRVVAPLVEEAARTHPRAVHEVADALYELSLEAIGRELFGRHPVILEGWSLLQQLTGHLAAQPRKVVAGVTNALYNLATTPGADPGLWLQIMKEVGPQCSDPAVLLTAGQVGAWRAGMAHYRVGALEACAKLDPSLVRLALRLPEDASVEACLQRIQDDPWADPTGEATSGRLALVARVGAFRGFGGLFLRPPRIGFVDGQWLITDEEATWQMTADRFGATLHRLQVKFPTASPATADYRLFPDGSVTRGNLQATFPELAEHASAASDGHALAVTTLRSHAVYVVAG